VGKSSKQQATDIFNARWSKQYRHGDEVAAGHGSREHYCRILRDLCGTFGGRRILALDVGCGTGRYFHCLKNVSRLVGIDVSPHMLAEARRPVRGDEIDIEQIDLRCCEIGSPELQGQVFDLIYSIGVFGEYAPIDAALLDRIFALLAPGGKLFLTAVDVHSRLQMPETAAATRTRRLLRRLFPLLPMAGRMALNRTYSSCYLTEREFSSLLQSSKFASFTIARYVHPSGWQGTHLDCLAHKAPCQATQAPSGGAVAP
jgi:SAM-dependent methyltransferase